MNKLARSALGARAVEGLLGATLGGGLAGSAGLIFHEPKEPREWLDAQGRVQGRVLSSEESKSKKQLVARVALLGALGGAAVSLGGSAFAGKSIAKAESALAKDIADKFLAPMRTAVDGYKKHHAVVASSPGGVGSLSHLGLDLKRKVDVAEQLLSDQEKAIHGMLGKAENRRAQVAFRGVSAKGDGARQLTHAGMVDQHFDDFAKSQGYENMRVGNSGQPNPLAPFEIFDTAVRKAMTKTSQASFAHEIYKIAMSKGQRRYRAKSGNYFGGEKKLQITAEETAAYKKRLTQAGLRSSNPKSSNYSNLPATLKKTIKGFSAHTHRARTSWYPTPRAIPLAKLKFIASTG